MVSWIIGVIESIGYIGIGFLMLLETFIPVIQSEFVMPFSGFSANVSGELNLYFVILAGIIGSELGAILLYFIARRLKEKTVVGWIGRYGKWVGFSEDTLQLLLGKFERHSKLTILIGRFVPGIRSVIAIPAGLRKIPFWEFALLNLVGTSFWVSLLCLLGYWLGNSYDVVTQYSSYVTYILLTLFIGYMLFGLAKRIRTM